MRCAAASWFVEIGTPPQPPSRLPTSTALPARRTPAMLYPGTERSPPNSRPEVDRQVLAVDFSA